MKWPWGRHTEEQKRQLAEATERAAEARALAAQAATATDATSVAVAELERQAQLVAARSRAARDRNHIGEMVNAAVGYRKERPA